MTVLMIASAPETEYNYVLELAQRADFIVCADGGIRHAAACGLTPDLVIGDFDSGTKPPESAEVISLNPIKDDSDLMCCTQEVIRRGADEIWYVCASGGRLDHFLANLSLLEYLYKQGVRGMLCDSKNRITFHPENCTIQYQADAAYKYVSMIPLDREVCGVTMRGLRYPLEDVVVSRDKMLTLSNEPTAPIYEIGLRTGCALVVESRD